MSESDVTVAWMSMARADTGLGEETGHGEGVDSSDSALLRHGEAVASVYGGVCPWLLTLAAWHGVMEEHGLMRNAGGEEGRPPGLEA